jgi:hypothetical protein
MATLSVHQTLKTRVFSLAGEGWEFTCPNCDYQVQYFVPGSARQAQLNIICLGDAQARHTSDCERNQNDPTQPVPHTVVEYFTEENWLNPGIRQQLSRIIEGLDA